MKNEKSIIKQLIEAKKSNDIDTYEELYEEISEAIESLCVSFTANTNDKEIIMMMSKILNKSANNLKEHAADI